MKLKLVLATSTAIGLIFATGAYADSNNVLLTQQKSSYANINQQYATGASATATQTGDGVYTDENDLTITQSGGTPSQNSAQEVTVNETYNMDGNARNNAVITEAGAGGNALTLNQEGANNRATISLTNNVSYTRNGDPHLAPAPSFSNLAMYSGYFDGGSLLAPGVVEQDGKDNNLNFTVNGGANAFALRQFNSGNVSVDNNITGFVTGSNNSVAVNQMNGQGNIANFEEDGNSSDVGIVQYNNNNTATADSYVGSNHIGFLQLDLDDSGRNTATGKSWGSNNVIGAAQAALNGGSNTTDIEDYSGVNNILAALQASVTAGNANVSNIYNNYSGANNLAVTAQYGNASGTNTITLNLNGSNANQPSSVFTGDAEVKAHASSTIGELLGSTDAHYASLAGAALGNYVDGHMGALIGASIVNRNILTPGLVTQVGSGNTATVSAWGNGDLFSTYQKGTGSNIITASQNGSSDQLAIAQIGNGPNSATVTQTSAGDNAGVTQFGANNTATITQ